MNQDASNQPTMTPERPKGRSNSTLLIIIVVLVVCCICAAAVGLFYQFGDAILNFLNGSLG